MPQSPLLSSPMIDVHVVAKETSAETLTKLGQLGFDTKKVVGGDPRVRMKYLLSCKSGELRASDDLYSRAVNVCEADQDFYGYIEQEVISSDMKLRSKGSSGSADPEMDFKVSPCPDNLYKGCDLHFAFRNIPPALQATMEKHDFYHLVLNKGNLGDVTIFTMQLEQAKQGYELWKVMLHYLDGLPDVDCDAKFEVTRNLVRFGNYPLPPLILKDTHPHFGTDKR